MTRSIRTIAFAGGSSLLLALSACGNGAGSGDDGATDGANGGQGEEVFQASFANFTESAPLFHAIKTNLDSVLAEGDSGVEVKWYDNEGDPGQMQQNAQLMVQDQPDAIIEYPVSASSQGISQIFAESDIPCVSVNLNTEACHFLNIDNAALGVETANIVGEVAKERGWDASNTTVLIGQNAASGEQVNDCVRYFYSTIAPILGMPEVDPSTITPTTTRINDNAIQFEGASTLQPSFEAVSSLLPSIPEDHNIILYTVNNDSTSGALRALEDAGRGEDLLVGGLGGDETGITALREDDRWVAEGDIFIGWWGPYAVAMAQAVAEGVEPPADVTPLPQIVLDKESVNEYHAEDGIEVVKLPPLVEDNEFLDESGFLEYVREVAGL